MPERIVVVAAVIERDGRFLIARRLKGTHLAGYWEFPGGKVHDGETQEEALQREISKNSTRESRRCGRSSTPLTPIPSGSSSCISIARELTGEPQPMLGQELRWITRDEFGALEFPPADAELIDGLINASL